MTFSSALAAGAAAQRAGAGAGLRVHTPTVSVAAKPFVASPVTVAICVERTMGSGLNYQASVPKRCSARAINSLTRAKVRPTSAASAVMVCPLSV